MHDIDGRLRLGEHRLAMLVEELAGLRQRELARGTLHETQVERGFEFGYGSRQTRLGDAQHTFGRRESTVLDDIREVHQVIEVVRVRFHALSSTRVFGCLTGRTIHCGGTAFSPKSGPYNRATF